MTVYNMGSSLHKKQISGLGNNKFLLCLESHGSDDLSGQSVWSHYEENNFEFSPNIKVLAFNKSLNAVAVIVEKIDPNIPEVIDVFDSDVEFQLSF